MVVGLETRDGGHGEYPIVSVRSDDGHDRAFHAFHTVVRSELEKLDGEHDNSGIPF